MLKRLISILLILAFGFILAYTTTIHQTKSSKIPAISSNSNDSYASESTSFFCESEKVVESLSSTLSNSSKKENTNTSSTSSKKVISATKTQSSLSKKEQKKAAISSSNSTKKVTVSSKISSTSSKNEEIGLPPYLYGGYTLRNNEAETISTIAQSHDYIVSKIAIEPEDGSISTSIDNTNDTAIIKLIRKADDTKDYVLKVTVKCKKNNQETQLETTPTLYFS